MIEPKLLSDGQLLAEFAATGSQSAFAQIVERHGAMVQAVARRVVGDYHEAQDVTQAAFLTLARKAASLRKDSSVGAWLHHVAWCLAQDARKAKHRREGREAAAMRDRELTEPVAVDQQAFHAELDGAINQMAERYRRPLVLFHLEGRTLQQTAAQLGLNPATTGTRLARARELLRKKLLRRGVGVGSVGALTALLSAESGAAVLPSTFVAATVKAATGGAVSTTVAALSQGALHTMFIAKVKTVSLTAAACLVVAGTGIVAAKQLTAVKPELAPASPAQPSNAAPVAVPAPALLKPPATVAGNQPAQPPPPPPPAAPVVNAHLAKQTAQAWVTALLAGRIDQALGLSDVPFRWKETHTDKTVEQLRRTIEGVVQAKGVRNLQADFPTILSAEDTSLQTFRAAGLTVVSVPVFPPKPDQVAVPTASGTSVTAPAGLLEWTEVYFVAIKPGDQLKVVGVQIQTRAKANTKADEARCLSKVRQICMALLVFAENHQGQLPESLDELAIGKETLRCPGAAGDVQPSYELLLPKARLADIKNPDKTLMVREVKAAHDGRRVAGFADGHVELANPE